MPRVLPEALEWTSELGPPKHQLLLPLGIDPDGQALLEVEDEQEEEPEGRITARVLGDLGAL